MSHILTVIWQWFCLATGLIALVAGVINLAAKAIPLETMLRWEKSRPRVANFFRFFRAAGPVIDKACRALFRIVTGIPWPSVLPPVTEPTPNPTAPEPPPGTTQPISPP
jgi:hypothetical protein